jgi:hypothetical protein
MAMVDAEKRAETQEPGKNKVVDKNGAEHDHHQFS